MFDALLKNKFCTKCKSAIKQTKTRIQIVKRKRNAMLKYLKNDVSDLLKNGLDSNAYGRVEGLWNELNLSSCYDFVEKICVHISTHLQNMNKRSECPEECREAVSSLIFAAARFADLPELRELRAAFTEKYGNSTEIFANKEFVNKLKGTPPTNDMRLQLMRDIAAEYAIEWNSKALEQKLYNNILSVPALHSHENDEIKEQSFAETTDDAAAAAADVVNKHKHQRGTDSPKKEGAGAGDFDNIKGGAQAERINRKQQQKQENSNGLTASEREVEGVPASHERKELTGIEIDLPIKRENAAVEGPQTDEERPFFYKPFRPPYTKPRTSNAVTSLTATPAGTENEVAEHTKEPSHIDRENHLRQGEPNGGKVKPVPKSVRRRFLKPQPVPADEGEEGEKQRKVALDHDPSPADEEEKKLDCLLAHYSKKKSSSGGSKLESAIDHAPQQAAAADNLTGRRRMDNKGKDGPPPRTVSLPNESSPADTPRKELSKAASFQAENCHIHPKLPEYEDFVARLAAFRGKLE